MPTRAAALTNSPFADLPRVVRDPYGKPLIARTPVSLYAFGDLIRRTELLLLELFSKGLLSGTTHTCLGQELCQMCVVRALTDPDDAVLSNHRNHGHFLTYSGDVLGLVAEIVGRGDGVCGGMGGSQHLAFRHFHSNGVQAGMTAIGAGLALARARRGSDGIVACIIGDGTLGEGLIYESMNLASSWRVPMLFVVEHNGIAQTTRTSDTIAGSIVARGSAFGLETWLADDADADLWVHAEQAVGWVRSHRRPGFLVVETRRLGPHSKGDDLRDADEMAVIRARDPLARLGDALDQEERARIDRDNRECLNAIHNAVLDPEGAGHVRARRASVVAAESRPTPRLSPVRTPAAPGRAERQNVRASLNAALRSLLTESPDVLLLGEDLHDPYGGAFKVTSGLSSEFPDRVISTPISEAAVVGSAIGLALAGYRPIAEVMFADFITLAMDQIYNHAVKFPGMFDDRPVPLVIRTPAGGRRGYGPTHSQSPENLMTAVPGLTVIFPSHRHPSGELLRCATLEWPHPVIFFEHKLLYAVIEDRGEYEAVGHPRDQGASQFPTLVRARRAPDLAVVAYGGMLPVVERAAAMLEAEDFSIEIVAPSLLQPLPRRTLTDLLEDKPCVAIVEEGHLGPGFGSELASTLAEGGFAGRLKRWGTPPVPIPAARALEARLFADEDRLAREFVELICAAEA